MKYPRTYHLPNSPGKSSDDKVQHDLSVIRSGYELVITEKMDGECTTMTSDAIWARSLDSVDHPSRHWVKGLWGQIRHGIPQGWRICGENLFAKHSIHYTNLDSYFLVHSIWDGHWCLNWKETKEWCELLGLTTVPVLCEETSMAKKSVGFYDFEMSIPDNIEGFVVRPKNRRFHAKDFPFLVLKYVRANHVQTDEHWMYQPIIKNILK